MQEAFAGALRNGYDTLLAEAHAKLSDGDRQRWVQHWVHWWKAWEAREHIHADIGFQLYTSIPRSKMAMEQKGGRVRRRVLFNKGLCTSAARKNGGVERQRGTAARKGLGVVA